MTTCLPALGFADSSWFVFLAAELSARDADPTVVFAGAKRGPVAASCPRRKDLSLHQQLPDSGRRRRGGAAGGESLSTVLRRCRTPSPGGRQTTS
ncbi:unnamed protein product [Spirodela intermedia]|uniref:Uncharacterized protein n=1 Tax=Spirodela intermedia TaxID=51605 RepID=A0A7I8K9X3_SPIIN|nr:unnamed protein product [Spirodela intermedia]